MPNQGTFTIVLKSMKISNKKNYITLLPKTFIANNRLNNNAPKLLKYFNNVSKISSLPKTYKHEFQFIYFLS
jgi:hypothetical protein